MASPDATRFALASGFSHVLPVRACKIREKPYQAILPPKPLYVCTQIYTLFEF
jgi:hypothetical protein